MTAEIGEILLRLSSSFTSLDERVAELELIEVDVSGGGGTALHVLATTSALGPFHTVSGLSNGQVLVATGGTTARFAQLLHNQLGGVADNDHHEPVTLGVGSDAILSLAGQELTLGDVATQVELDAHIALPNPHHEPITLGVGSDAILSLAGQELTLGDVATQVELDAHIALPNPHHEPITLGVGSDAILSLAGQELTLGDVATQVELDAHTANADAHHAQSHVLITQLALGPYHTITGGVSGYILKATGATTARLMQLLHSELGSIGANDHHAQSHVLVTQLALGPYHTITGGVSGYILKATGATTARLMQLLHSELGSIGANDHHSQSHVLATTAALGPDHTVSGLTAGQVLRATGATTAAFASIQDGDLPSTIVRTSRTITAGAGLTGGGDLSADRTIDVATADTSMTINADSIQVRLASPSGLIVSSGLALFVPGTLTTITTNILETGSGGHTHAITTTSVGTASTIVATNASGQIQLEQLGIGTAPVNYRGIDMQYTYVGISASIPVGVNVSVTHTPSAAHSYVQAAALKFSSRWNKAATLGTLFGITGTVINNSSGTITNAVGASFGVSNLSTGTITTATSVLISSPSDAIGGIVTNYGLRIEYQPGYSIHTASGTVSFGDDLEFRQAAVISTIAGNLDLNPFSMMRLLNADLQMDHAQNIRFLNSAGTGYAGRLITSGDTFQILNDRSGGAIIFQMQSAAAAVMQITFNEGDTNDPRIYFGGDGSIGGSGQVKIAPDSGNYVVIESQKTTTGDPTGVEGLIYWNTIDNAIKMYADGGWRTLASW